MQVYGRRGEKKMWWVCGCRSKCISETNNSLTSSGTLFRVSSFILNTCRVWFLSDTFSEEAVIPNCSLCSELAITLVASRPENAFIDPIADWILGLILLSIAVKIAFWILSSTMSTILNISLSNLSMKHLSKVFAFTTSSLTAGLLSQLPTANSWSAVTSFNVVFSVWYS